MFISEGPTFGPLLDHEQRGQNWAQHSATMSVHAEHQSTKYCIAINAANMNRTEAALRDIDDLNPEESFEYQQIVQNYA